MSPQRGDAEFYRPERDVLYLPEAWLDGREEEAAVRLDAILRRRQRVKFRPRRGAGKRRT